MKTTKLMIRGCWIVVVIVVSMMVIVIVLFLIPTEWITIQIHSTCCHFRTKENLSSDFVDGSVPLIFPQHLQNCSITWPIPGAKKPNALLNNESTSNLMVPNGTYVLTRRLTAKEEKRRIVASIYSAELADVDVVGFENKTNYFHINGGPLDDLLARGLWVFLNSTLVDKYFRQMNGHTQVNATDLRTLRYPTRQQLEQIATAADFTTFDQVKADKIIDEILS